MGQVPTFAISHTSRLEGEKVPKSHTAAAMNDVVLLRSVCLRYLRT